MVVPQLPKYMRPIYCLVHSPEVGDVPLLVAPLDPAGLGGGHVHQHEAVHPLRIGCKQKGNSNTKRNRKKLSNSVPKIITKSARVGIVNQMNRLAGLEKFFFMSEGEILPFVIRISEINQSCAKLPHIILCPTERPCV
jgi:hypothetical protein